MVNLLPKEDLGQVWTSTDIALAMAEEALKLCPTAKMVLDPACGPGTFSYALHSANAIKAELHCYDVDERMVKETTKVNKKLNFKGIVHSKDYLLDSTLEGKFDIVIMNPPYIRQEDILSNKKDTYHAYLGKNLGTKIDRRANLFALFLLKGIVDLAPGGILCAIVYDAITHTAYGKQVLGIIESHADLISQRHVKSPFQDVLIDAKILVFRKRNKPLKKVDQKQKMPTKGKVFLSDLLTIRRGTALPLRELFIADVADPHFKSAEPFFIKQAPLQMVVTGSRHSAYLINPESKENKRVQEWLEKKAQKLGANHKRLTVKSVTGSIVFNYYIRSTPRHLWNLQAVPTSDNFYVSSAKEGFPAEAAWLLLNSRHYISKLVQAARNQGNGLLKLQLYEYKGVEVPDWRILPRKKVATLVQVALSLISSHADYNTVIKAADKATRGLFND